MKKLLQLKASLGRIAVEGRDYQIFADAAAGYDTESKMLSVDLGCFLQEDFSSHVHRPGWMPQPQTDREHVDEDEATELARDIFRRWCDSIKHAALNRPP